jgi:D-xylulose reductase
MNDSYMASPPTDGTLCQWYACPATNAVKIPDSISWEESGCIQPLAIAIQVARRAGLRAHQNVVVFGCGPLGLLCMAVAKAYGARNIIAVDISTKRLEFAKSYAATHTFLPTRKPQEQDVMQWNASLASQVLSDAGIDFGVDVAIEASGAEPCMQLAIAMLRTGGTCR